MNGLLARSAVARASVLVVEVPGWSRARCAVEAELRRRGWRPAVSPADADALVVCGQPAERLSAAVELVWEQLPGPRARATVPAASDAAAALDGVHAELADDARQRRLAAARSTDPAMGRQAGAVDEGQGDHVEDDHHGENSGSDMNHGDMDHGDMDMPMPGGIPLAGGAEDRDGLEMDVLHVPLGPVLPVWPAGLLLWCTVAGDVVTEAAAEVLGPDGPAPVTEALVHGSPADRMDRVAALLTLAGWGAAATTAARLRDELLVTADPAELLPQLDRLTGRLGRSRSLRWSLSARGGTQSLDPFQRLLDLLSDARAALTGSATPVTPTPLDDLSGLVAGQQLSWVRLVVAAAELDAATLARVGASS